MPLSSVSNEMPFEPVESKTRKIASVGYNADSKRMQINYSEGKSETFEDVSPEDYATFRETFPDVKKSTEAYLRKHFTK